MDPEEYRKKIEQDILDIIEQKLKSGDMSVERAREIARFVLDKLHPPLTLEQIYQIAPSLDDHFTELAKAILPVVQEHDDKVKAIVAEHAEKLIKSGKLEDALALLKNSNNNGTSV